MFTLLIQSIFLLNIFFLHFFSERVAEEGGPPAEPTEPEIDPDEAELEKLEKGDPEMLKICNITLVQLEDFKVCYNLFKNFKMKFLSKII
jgi:hypothetical protein